MTLPNERTRAVIYTHRFLCDLLDPEKTPRVPKYVREYASRCLRHYPTNLDLYRIIQNAEKLLAFIPELEKDND